MDYGVNFMLSKTKKRFPDLLNICIHFLDGQPRLTFVPERFKLAFLKIDFLSATVEMLKQIGDSDVKWYAG